MNEALLFLTQHGALVIFITVLGEQIGLPIPALPVLIAAGALVGTRQMNIEMAVGSALLAALLGDQLWFELGRRRGRAVLSWLCRISLEPSACVRRTEDFFASHGVRSLVVAKFIPGLSTIAPPLAGIVGLRLPQYLLYNGIGTMLWVGSGIGLGMVFSNQLEQALLVIADLGHAFALMLLGIVTGYVGYKGFHHYRAGQRVPRLTARQLTEKIAAGEDPILIDLRSLGARQDDPGIPGSLPLSFDEVIARHRELPRDRDLVLYCACPHDAASVEVTRQLRELGLTRVWPLAGGIEAWHALQVEQGELIFSPAQS